MSDETTRLEAFSDGVFAIAITLLVLEIRVPESEDISLGPAVLHLWPSFLAFATSFFEIGVMWINHHRLFTMIGRTDQRLLIWNTLLLFGIAFVPFPTALIARHLHADDAWVGALVYNATLLYISIPFNLLWRHASRDRRLIGAGVDQSAVDAITGQYRFGPLMYLGLLLALSWSGVLTLATHLAVAIYFLIPPRR